MSSPQFSSHASSHASSASSQSSLPVSPSLYPEYACVRNAPLSCDRPWQTTQEFKGAKFCMGCGFPATLTAGQKIRGRRGIYQVKQFLGARGYGRLYSGVRSVDGQPVVIKEYLLPERYFNATAAKRRQESFEQLAGLVPADGLVQDFRLEQPLEAIATPKEARCYLVIAEKAPPPTLRQFLATQGAMLPEQVREVLNQALQTLQFIHTQKFRRPSGRVEKGTVHGNLHLESMLISSQSNSFYIYLCDLASWEFLFDPTLSMLPVQAKPVEDLDHLGRIGFELWRGQETEPNADYSTTLYNHQPWMHSDPPLREFLLRLMGFGTPFETAEAARQALLQLPLTGQDTGAAIAPSSEPLNRRRKTRIWWLLAGVLLLFLGSLAFFLLRRAAPEQESYAEFKRLRQKFTDVTGIEKGTYLYTSEAEGTWSHILTQPVQQKLFGQLLTQPNPNQQAVFEHRGVASKGLQDSTVPSAAIQAVRQQQAQFAITSLPDPSSSPSDPYSSDPIAYDGILVYVPFSQQGENLPKSLAGRITMADLRQIFTGQITRWSQIGGLDRAIDVRVPTDPEAVYWFKKRVLGDDPQAIARFNQFVETRRGITSETLQRNLQIFDDDGPGIISFGILSKVWDQCKGYPLAIVDDQGNSFQPLRRNASSQPITPSDPICDKANHLDGELFTAQRYPLAYPLAVVYPRGDLRPGGEKFAALLQTQQGQCALTKVGLVPLQPVPPDCTPPQ